MVTASTFDSRMALRCLRVSRHPWTLTRFNRAILGKPKMSAVWATLVGLSKSGKTVHRLGQVPTWVTGKKRCCRILWNINLMDVTIHQESTLEFLKRKKCKDYMKHLFWQFLQLHLATKPCYFFPANNQRRYECSTTLSDCVLIPIFHLLLFQTLCLKQ